MSETMTDPWAIPDPQPDVPLLRKAVEWMQAQAALPEKECQWVQGQWVIPAETIGRECGTCYCVAGYVASLTGEVHTRTQTMAGSHEHVWQRAQHALGLTEYEADWLFQGGNDLADVQRIAGRIAARAGDTL
jgi:hypothetical protein